MSATPPLMIFDDERGRFGPLTDRRPAFDLLSGVLTSRQRMLRILEAELAGLIVPAALSEVMRAREPGCVVNGVPEAEACLLVNGRWDGLSQAEAVRGLGRGEALLSAGGAVVASHLGSEDLRRWLDSGRLPESVHGRECEGVWLFERPWHLLERLKALLEADLGSLDLPAGASDLEAGLRIVGSEPVRIAGDADLLGPVTIDARRGPVAIDAGAVVRPFCVIEGPAYVGAGATLAAHTSLRPGSMIGRGARVGGEISLSIVGPCSNKAHAGYLGQSIVGEWCNLGADTNVSNLKNTYGPVRVQLDVEALPEDTGRTTHGPILGDYVRTAIGTRLMTGAVLGTATMLAVSGHAPKLTRAFEFHTDRIVEHTQWEAFHKTLERMHERKGQAVEPAEVELLRALHGRGKS